MINFIKMTQEGAACYSHTMVSFDNVASQTMYMSNDTFYLNLASGKVKVTFKLKHLMIPEGFDWSCKRAKVQSKSRN